MKNSENNKKILFLILTTAFIGFADSVYLGLKDISNSVVTCSLSGGCNDVLNSPFALLLGIIPLAYAGIIYYFTTLVLTLMLIIRPRTWLIRLLSILTLSGFIMSLSFVYIQIYEIYAICQYCMLSALTSTVLFIASGWLYLKIQKNS